MSIGILDCSNFTDLLSFSPTNSICKYIKYEGGSFIDTGTLIGCPVVSVPIFLI